MEERNDDDHNHKKRERIIINKQGGKEELGQWNLHQHDKCLFCLLPSHTQMDLRRRASLWFSAQV